MNNLPSKALREGRKDRARLTVNQRRVLEAMEAKPRYFYTAANVSAWTQGQPGSTAVVLKSLVRAGWLEDAGISDKGGRLYKFLPSDSGKGGASL